MIRKVLNQIILALITAGIWFIYLSYPRMIVFNLFFTALSLTLIYFFFKLVLEETVSQKIKNKKTRYSFRKVVSILYILGFIVILFRIWIEDPQALLVTYGLIAAGVAIALQDFFKSFLGGILIFLTNIYTVGDRVELDERFGDVIDIGILSTTLLEIKGWVDGDQPTGRIVTVPNKVIISDSINNYTKDNNFLWDEINIPIKYGSDWKKTIQIIEDITKEETLSMTESAAEELKGLQKKYYLSKKAVEPSVYVRMTDNWIDLNVRYITDARNRRGLHDRLSRKILEALRKEEDVDIASETLDISSFPEM